VKDLLDRRRAWSDAVNARDIDAYADIVAEDVVWIPPSGDAIVGRAETVRRHPHQWFQFHRVWDSAT
jgi:ketosteroid isomerase-like protein